MKLQNKVKIMKSAQNGKYYQKLQIQVEEAWDKSGLLSEIKILLLFNGHNFLKFVAPLRNALLTK